MGGTRLAGSVGPSSLPHETLPHEPNGGPFRTQFTSHSTGAGGGGEVRKWTLEKGPKKSKERMLFCTNLLKFLIFYKHEGGKQNANEGKRPD